MGTPGKAAELQSTRHPLQRFEAPSKGFSGALHSTSYGWHLQFLTIIGLALSTLTFLLALLSDLTSATPPSPPTSLSTHLFAAKNALSSVATPLALTISTLYWPLRLAALHLVLPPGMPLPPLHADLGFHAVPAGALVLDAVALSPPGEWGAGARLAGCGVVAGAYWVWIDMCYAKNGFYPYPLFEVLGTGQRVLLFGAAAATMWAVGGVVSAVYAWVNGYEVSEAEMKVRRAQMMGQNGKWE
ncbi:FAR-17a/AIG1-like protein-domain-containing protein [Boeremia exigua]|uniref:FAR-17a/AIG1-like protein-domain-containing protein n=1 Tax=Boeremia exigua TaxID=749465 RepID=UPI001E8E2DF6|nr:FAR-17a/AIG1-like protein-domain-containing protein [Boeremia exigua]KAH6612415.1 FAR-17a/AIG1-like protein-domain-containing protein [Boeremia exigua]